MASETKAILPIFCTHLLRKLRVRSITVRAHFKRSFFAFLLFSTVVLRVNAVQRELPYFVDIAGSEVDLEENARAASMQKTKLSEAERLRRGHHRWVAYLRSDGTWEPNFIKTSEDYVDRHYLVEYVLPFGYRGLFQIWWGVRGASPLQIINDKIEVYIPADGIVKTSSPGARQPGGLPSGDVAGVYVERNGNRTPIPFQPQEPGVVGIFYGGEDCGISPDICVSRFYVGSEEDGQPATYAKCTGSEEAARVFDPEWQACTGSTTPVSEIVQSRGKPAVAPEVYGLSLKGRRVVLSWTEAGVPSWRYDGPEPEAPDPSTLVAELQTYIKTSLARNTGESIECRGATADQISAVLKRSLAGPYHFIRPPFSNTIEAQFLVDQLLSPGTIWDGIVFIRRDGNWKLVGCHNNHDRHIQPENGARLAGVAAMGGGPVFLREDGTWNADFFDAALQPDTYPAHDMNGGELTLEFAGGRRNWRRVSKRTLPIHLETVSSELQQALDRYINLLLSGNVQQFLVEGGKGSIEWIHHLTEYCDQQSNRTDFLCKDWHFYGETGFKAILRRAAQEVDVPATIQELRQLHSETPRISPILFSADLEASYTLPPKGPGQFERRKRLRGHGSKWAFDTNQLLEEIDEWKKP